MRSMLSLPASWAFVFAFSAYLSPGQVLPANTASKTLPLTIGVGFSNYDTGLNQDRLNGGTLWVDYGLGFLPGPLHGLGLEAEGRDLNLSHSSDQPFLREDVAAGGGIYHWNRNFPVRPFLKFLAGYGNADYLTSTGLHYRQSRTVTLAGGGLEVSPYPRIRVRADYEYQWWPDFFKNGPKPSGQLNPMGITLGVAYRLDQPAPH